MQAFLRRTAVLDRFTGPLCDAVLGESGAQERLRALEASNSFLVPLDRTREWYRYHPLFRDFLLGELRTAEPEQIEKLQVRAADWFLANGSPAMAVEYLLSTAEQERSARLVAQLVPVTYSAGQISTVQRWMASLGSPAIRAYPPLAVLAGWITALVGDTADAQRWAAVVDEVSFDEVPEGGPASFASSRAMLRAMMCPAGPEQLMADAELAVAQETPSSQWRDTALYSLAEAHLLAGDVDRAVAAFEEATSVGLALGHTDPIVSCDVGAGDPRDGRRPVGGGGRPPRDRARHHRGPPDARLRHQRAGLRGSSPARRAPGGPGPGRPPPHPGHAVPSALARSWFPSWRSGGGCSSPRCTRPAVTRPPRGMLLREIDDILKHRPLLGALVDEVAEFRRLASGAAAARTGVSPLTSAELRLLPYLQTYLTIAEIADRLRVTRNTVGTEVSAIYRKLGVSSRGDAVRQATALGLLGG